MKLRSANILLVLLLVLGCARGAAEGAALPRLRATLGKLEPSALVCGPVRSADCQGLEQASRSAKMRAQALDGNGDEAELDFLYLGPTEEVAPLASGEIRRQLGIKLRAQDSCNVLYVMWRIEPVPGIYVSRKSNPGTHTHKLCGTSGYHTIRAQIERPLPPLLPGERHRLRAKLEGRNLWIWLDGTLIWKGKVDATVLRFDGPVGIRSDNVRFAFRLLR